MFEQLQEGFCWWKKARVPEGRINGIMKLLMLVASGKGKWHVQWWYHELADVDSKVDWGVKFSYEWEIAVGDGEPVLV